MAILAINEIYPQPLFYQIFQDEPNIESDGRASQNLFESGDSDFLGDEISSKSTPQIPVRQTDRRFLPKPTDDSSDSFDESGIDINNQAFKPVKPTGKSDRPVKQIPNPVDDREIDLDETLVEHLSSPIIVSGYAKKTQNTPQKPTPLTPRRLSGKSYIFLI